jgi:hypothetical protein
LDHILFTWPKVLTFEGNGCICIAKKEGYPNIWGYGISDVLISNVATPVQTILEHLTRIPRPVVSDQQNGPEVIRSFCTKIGTADHEQSEYEQHSIFHCFPFLVVSVSPPPSTEFVPLIKQPPPES